MDTLEQPHGIMGQDNERAPILWRGKSPQDLLREKHSDCRVTTHIKGNKSLVPNAEYCEKLYLSKTVVRDGKEIQVLVSTLIPIPEKP